MNALKDLLEDEGIYKAIIEAETETEQQLIMLALIRNNLKKIKGWVTFFGVISIFGIVVIIFL